MKLQLHKLEGNTFNITEQANSSKILSDNKEITNALKTIKETQENLKELINTWRDDSSIISNKIRTVEEEIGKNQVKINEHIELEKKIELSVEELWKLVERTDTENKWYQVRKKGKVIDLQEQSRDLRSEHLKENRTSKELELVIFGGSTVDPRFYENGFYRIPQYIEQNVTVPSIWLTKFS